MGRGRLRNLADDIFFQLSTTVRSPVQLACQLNASPWTEHVLGLVLVYTLMVTPVPLKAGVHPGDVLCTWLCARYRYI
jgi:hypothetical protein